MSHQYYKPAKSRLHRSELAVPGSSPKKRDITFKWAVLLTGINSVKPWIKPYKINSKYSKNS